MGMIVGLCGFPGSGKSEVRNILVRDHGFEFVCSKSLIYDIASRISGVPENKFSDPVYKDDSIPLGRGRGELKYRRIAGEVGMLIEDLFGQDYLIKQALANHRVLDRDKNFVIDSFRMNQATLLKVSEYGKNIECIEVVNNRVGAPPPRNTFDKYELPPKFVIIENGGTITELEVEVSQALAKLKAKRYA